MIEITLKLKENYSYDDEIIISSKAKFKLNIEIGTDNIEGEKVFTR